MERARRFRIVFWMVAWLGALPSLLSGLLMLGHFRLETLCAVERPTASLDQLRTVVRLARLHQWGHVGALVAGLLVIAYSVAWSFEKKRLRALTLGLAAGVLLPALGVASWTGRVTPWRALEPPVSVGGEQMIAAPAEWGGPQYCQKHEDEVLRLRRIYRLHIAAGAIAVLLTLALTDLGARWRAAKDATSASS